MKYHPTFLHTLKLKQNELSQELEKSINELSLISDNEIVAKKINDLANISQKAFSLATQEMHETTKYKLKIKTTVSIKDFLLLEFGSLINKETIVFFEVLSEILSSNKIDLNKKTNIELIVGIREDNSIYTLISFEPTNELLNISKYYIQNSDKIAKEMAKKINNYVSPTAFILIENKISNSLYQTIKSVMTLFSSGKNQYIIISDEYLIDMISFSEEIFINDVKKSKDESIVLITAEIKKANEAYSEVSAFSMALAKYNL